ncbi:unnamed protein product [Peronospora belbahrii]|uniref:Uncharacterized protein n=1 Tax=Peronospora belbahrii TaxID=622444 RepID=A0ABN8D0Z6_9STRA|nr:unnamed protein product [Peronospora belbahrii]
MNADDEPSIAYFVRNDITGDSVQKNNHLKASFGPIGGRNTAVTVMQSRAICSRNESVAFSAFAASNAKSDVDFNGLYTRPRASLETLLCGSSKGPVLSHDSTSLLQSDLSGDVYTLQASRDFRSCGGTISSSSNSFGLSRPFESRFSGEKATEDAGAIMSPILMLDRQQEAAEGFALHGDTRKSIAATESFGIQTQQLYHGREMSSDREAGVCGGPFESRSNKKWLSLATEASLVGRVLRRPPGLMDPPRNSKTVGMQSCIGSGGGGMIQQQGLDSQFLHFNCSNVLPLASKGASHKSVLSGDNHYGSSLLSSSWSSKSVYGDSSLRDPFCSRGVLNLDLAELNTHSIQVGEMDGMGVRQADDASYNRTPTTSRRNEIQSSRKTLRSPKKTRDERNMSERRLSPRGEVLETDSDAVNVIAPISAINAKRCDESGLKMALTLNAHSPSSNECSANGNNLSARRGKRRNHVGHTGKASSLFGFRSNESRWRETSNQSKKPGFVINRPPGLKESDNRMKLALRESGKLKRREDVEPSSRTALTGRYAARGNDTMAGTARRRVFRKKQEKKSKQGILSSEKSAPIPAIVSQRTQKSNNDSMPKANFQERYNYRRQDIDPGDVPFTYEAVCEVLSSIEARSDDTEEAVDKSVEKHREKRNISANTHDEVAEKTVDEIGSTHTLRGAPPEDPASTCIYTERESFLLGDTPEYKSTMGKEPVEQALDQQLMDSKKSKKDVGYVESLIESSASVTKAAALDGCPQAAVVEKNHSTNKQCKEKFKKEKVDRKRVTRGRKDKHEVTLIPKTADKVNSFATEAQDKLLTALATKFSPLSAGFIPRLRNAASVTTTAVLLAFSRIRRSCVRVALWLNIKGLFATTSSYAESVLMVASSVVLLLSSHAASWLVRIHRDAFRVIYTHHHIGFCFAFLYGFPFLVQYVFPWAPPWAPVCLWYAFLVQLFCTNGSTAMVTTFRVILPLVFLIEGISHHSFLLDFNGAELLLTSFIISALKTSNLCSPIFFLSLASQCLLAVFLGSNLIVQWLQLALALYSLHLIAAADNEWMVIAKEEDDRSCHPVPTHHSIVDYNHHLTPPSAMSIQKIKGLDRRALVRGRKLR